ncbi:hypothetical protein FRACYDRAFT_245641 [Fragilariopsis cylindrus CCMP1102]|uniref:FAS1 domain-containing protein n=1 Tax=Fragilariopsis cylindrus CCMP1102 TaxID=635003 RepID=A0A1E7EZH7_9STRA|nr:hypothetical protein FRACYDRAFT_245641 [Fragilariopsis cylindrus CCMP1102]|eukprot:OEU11331.1 hypothetical protein FRACYDRAFT_245641 [Fragilariopsis cylindrus CCMP1102]
MLGNNHNNSTKQFLFLLVTSWVVTFSTAFTSTFSSSSSSCSLFTNCNNAAVLTAAAGESRSNSKSNSILYSSNSNGDSILSSNNNDDLLLLRQFLQDTYPTFYKILDMNEEIWKAIGDTSDDADGPGFTVFVPSDIALQELGDTKVKQLLDIRNLEATQKIVGYHVISETVDAESLFQAGGIKTVSGEVPIERSISGGFFGVGGKEDGGVTLNQAKVLRTKKVGTGLVHEVDALVSPQIVWRFMDQLRIPGST